METVVVADQRAGVIHLLNPTRRTWTTPLVDTVLAEHAGLLHLPDGQIAFADDATGELVLLDPTTTPPQIRRTAIAIPAEHLAADPAGHHIAVSTGLGASFTGTNDQFTLIDLTRTPPRPRRVRTRPGEPGIALTEDSVLLRHREPGSVQAISFTEIDQAGPHVPTVTGISCDDLDDTGHGDVFDPQTGRLMMATDRGVEQFDLADGAPRAVGIIPWYDGHGDHPGRAYFLRFCPRRRIVVATLRRGGDDPTMWHRWHNSLWIHHVDEGVTTHVPVGDGLVFRCALTPTALVTTRIHPDGDELLVHDLPDLRARGCWALPPMAGAPRPGHAPWDHAERRAVAAAPYSEQVLVSQGGHGEVHLVDVSSPRGDLVTLDAPSPLHDGGHLGWFDDRVAPAHRDRIGR
ncbi:hypothetical protein KEM60_03339 [Austwickia sp. TVS 96-490-7B]|uniref:hypothetical protein n=1 Tax=Austwickia sp. TVS 96-490-7B TaxID=2830843 RepID=UPI001C56C1C1|nr:hypothetical protein [Austwickia sp. TVS 96-490-7B]MBW3087109.1 hypothetical protein [Austwickia sp. TVS 96-490-7B]